MDRERGIPFRIRSLLQLGRGILPRERLETSPPCIRSVLEIARTAVSGTLRTQVNSKRVVCGTLVDSPPVERLAVQNQIEAYTLPQGCLSQLTREMAAGRPGLVTHVGLRTFVDPRYGGGRQSALATEDLVELVNIAGHEYLFFKPFHVDVALLRGTTADEDGNVTMEHEAVFGEMISMAQAARRAGGIVIVQVKRLALRGTLPPKQVKIPGMLVDFVVVDPNQTQTFFTGHDAAYAGELKIPLSADSRTGVFATQSHRAARQS